MDTDGLGVEWDGVGWGLTVPSSPVPPKACSVTRGVLLVLFGSSPAVDLGEFLGVYIAGYGQNL